MLLVETVCSAVSAAGLGIAAITAYRKRFLTATRLAAYSLVPVGLVMTGAVGWISGMVFKPVVWAGFGVLALAWLLFMITRAVERRTGGSRKERKAAKAARREAVAPAAAAPSLGASRPATAPDAAPAPAAAAAQPKKKAADEDFSDIEAILKKHGI